MPSTTLGQVVGSAVTANGSNHPFLYSNGQMTDLGTLGSPDGTDWWNSAQSVNKFGRRGWHILRCPRQLLRVRLEKRDHDEDGDAGRPLEPGLRRQQ